MVDRIFLKSFLKTFLKISRGVIIAFTVVGIFSLGIWVIDKLIPDVPIKIITAVVYTLFWLAGVMSWLETYHKFKK